MAAASETVLQALVFDYLSRKDKTLAEVYQKKFKSVSGVLSGDSGFVRVGLVDRAILGPGKMWTLPGYPTRVFVATHFHSAVEMVPAYGGLFAGGVAFQIGMI